MEADAWTDGFLSNSSQKSFGMRTDHASQIIYLRRGSNIIYHRLSKLSSVLCQVIFFSFSCMFKAQISYLLFKNRMMLQQQTYNIGFPWHLGCLVTWTLEWILLKSIMGEMMGKFIFKVLGLQYFVHIMQAMIWSCIHWGWTWACEPAPGLFHPNWSALIGLLLCFQHNFLRLGQARAGGGGEK